MEEPELFKVAVRPPRKRKPPQEYKVVALRDCPLPEYLLKCETPEHAADYWRRCISTLPSYDPDKESFVVLLLTTRRHVKGHHLVATGTLDQVPAFSSSNPLDAACGCPTASAPASTRWTA